MNPQESLLQSIEKLGYRVTVGDVAAKSGLEINAAQQGLLALAAEAGGHLQVADTGEIIYLFPENFRSILLNKYWQLQLVNGIFVNGLKEIVDIETTYLYPLLKGSDVAQNRLEISHYWYLGLAYLLEAREEEAHTTWLFVLSQVDEAITALYGFRRCMASPCRFKS